VKFINKVFKGGIILKQIKIYSDESMFNLAEEVNDFIKNNNTEIYDIQYSTTCRGSFLTTITQHSVMISYEEK